MKRLLALLLCAALLVPACAALAETEGEKKALECALQYLDALYFSRSELYDQLLYEQYSPEEAAWAIGQLDYIDWFDQAAGFAEGQMKYSPEYSQLGLADLLLSCGFTAEEAKYGAAVAFGEKAEKPAVTSTPAPLPEISLFPVLPEVTTEPEGTPVPETTPDLPASTPVPEVSPTETPAADDRRLEALQFALAYTADYWSNRADLYIELLLEGYTEAEALYALDNIQMDWYAEAAGYAAQCRKGDEDATMEELEEVLLEAGYTAEEARYGVEAAFGLAPLKPAVTPTPMPLPHPEDIPMLRNTPQPTPVPTEPVYTPVPDLMSPTPEPAAPVPTPEPAQVTILSSFLTTKELIALRKQVDDEIHSRPEWKEVEVPAGTWTIGEDIPAGFYSVRSLSTYSGTLYIYKTDSPYWDKYYSIRLGGPLGKVELQDGWKVEVQGTLVFAPPEAPAFN